MAVISQEIDYLSVIVIVYFDTDVRMKGKVGREVFKILCEGERERSTQFHCHST